MPRLYVCGISHERAELAIRERFAIGKPQVEKILSRLGEENLATEAFVLSTCNRTEVYAYGPEYESFETQLEKFFLTLATPELDAHHTAPLYNYNGIEAVRHFFAVNSGLNSMILGENEIKAQIREAFELSKSAGMAGQNLHRLIDRANRCAKRVKTETGLNSGTLSFGRASVMRAEEVLGTLAGKCCVVIGAGKIGRAAAVEIASRNPGKLTIVNRSEENAQAVADGLDAEVLPIHRMAEAVRDADLMLGAAFAPNFLVTRAMFEQVRKGAEPGRPVCLIDAAVPRILDREIRHVAGVTLLDIGDLEGVVAANREKRIHASQRAWELTSEEVEKFESRVRSAGFGPAIERLRLRFDTVFEELESEHGHHLNGDAGASYREAQRRLKQRLLHEAIQEIKGVGRNGTRD